MDRQGLLDALDHAVLASIALQRDIAKPNPEVELGGVLASQLERVEQLRDVFRRHGLEVPDHQWATTTSKSALAAEEAALETFQRLASDHHDRAHLLGIYQTLVTTSQTRHLPVLRSAAEAAA